MGAKKIKKRTAGRTASAPVFRFKSTEDGSDVNFYAEEIDNSFVLNDPNVVADFEATGLKLQRFPSADTEAVFLWLISKKSPDRKDIGQEFAHDFADAIRDRAIGGTLAELARMGHLRVMATRDDAGVIVQMTPGSQEIN